MAVYPKEVIFIEPNQVIHLKYVESFSFDNTEITKTFNTLKDDCTFSIRTVSGKEYEISSKFILTKMDLKTYTPEDLAMSIYDKWVWIHRSY